MPFTMTNFEPPTREQASPFANVLSNALNMYQQGVKARYMPMVTQADAASKLAYANLMAPQFLAKLMGNRDILANLTDDQRGNALNLVLGAGMGQGTGNSVLRNILGGNANNPSVSNIPNMPAAQQQPEQSTQMQQSQSSFPNGNVQFSPEETRKAMDAYVNSPEAQQQTSKNGYLTIPRQDQLMNWYRNQGNPAQQNTQVQPQEDITQQPNEKKNTFAKNVGEYGGLVKEGEELGTQRAKDIGILGDVYQKTLDAKVPLDNLINVMKNPVFQNMRRYPGFQNLQLGVKANFGTPEEQQMIGDFQANAMKAAADAVNNFQGNKLVSEVGMVNQMKISPKDTINVAVGKLPSIYQYNEMASQRAKLTAQIMENAHVSKYKALEQADKMVNGNQIRKQIEDNLSPKVTIRNPKTGESITIPLSEAKREGFAGG